MKTVYDLEQFRIVYVCMNLNGKKSENVLKIVTSLDSLLAMNSETKYMMI